MYEKFIENDLFDKSRPEKLSKRENKEKLDKIFSLFGKTNFSYFLSKIDAGIKVYDYYKEFAENLIFFLNSEQNIFNKQINKYKFVYNYLIHPDINAGAIIENNEEKIIITEGLILKIYELFYKINATRNIFNIKCEDVNTLYKLDPHAAGAAPSDDENRGRAV